MLFSLRSMALSSALIAASPLADGAFADTPEPVVTPAPVFDAGPDEFAVPALSVPGAGGAATFAELPTPLGSLPELLRPPALAGPDGTPLTPDVPAPAEPADGEPAALPLVLPALCANELAGSNKMAIATSADVADDRVIGILLCIPTAARAAGSAAEQSRSAAIESAEVATQEAGPVVRKLIAFDDDTFDKLKQLGRDRMATIQELADEAFADVLKKHGIPIDLKDALRKSAAISKAPAAKASAAKNAKSSSQRKTKS
jgi:hypothetical protein